MKDYGILTTRDTIRFERLLPGSIERVWAHLVEPDKRALWLAGGPMDLVVDGAIELHFRNADLSRNDDRAPEKYRAYENNGTVIGRITRCEKPRMLAFTWSDSEDVDDVSEVIIELDAREDGVLLTLTHRKLCREHMPSVGAGWHTHLGILEDRLHDREPRAFWRTHTALESEYVVRLDSEQ